MVSKSPRPRAKEKACDNAIKETLVYSAIFNFPLSRFQLYTLLKTEKWFSEEFFEKSLRRLVKKGNVKAKDGKYYLPGVRPVSWNLRAKYSEELVEENKLAIDLLKKIPWIKLMAITGSVATHGASKDDDVDIFIVTRKNRIWLTRGFVALILTITNRYANEKHHDRKLCCNLYVDETKMKWPENRQNFYIAHEIVRMHPIYDKELTYFKFMRANKWVFDHFKNNKLSFPDKFSDTKKGSLFVDWLENLAFKVQSQYMKDKKTTEITTREVIHFNKNDHMKRILNEYSEALEKIQ